MKLRIDNLLVQEGHATNRSKAKQLIADRLVSYNGHLVKKSGQMVNLQGKLEVQASTQYVGRGAKKIAAAIEAFQLDPKDKIIADVGASTGGFTDYLLQNGAQKVYAIDVGHGQLDLKLQKDPRVINMEGTNIKDLNALPELVDFAVVDLSYISLTKTLEHIVRLIKEPKQIIALLKPQFEAGPQKIGKQGVIRDPAILQEVISDFYAWCQQNNYTIDKKIPSPIKGKEGNQEFLLLLSVGQ